MTETTATGSAPRLRSACDVCHHQKVRCSGSLPCENCASSSASCYYSATNRLGRPRGAKNKRQAGAAPARPARVAANGGDVPLVSSDPVMDSTSWTDSTWQAHAGTRDPQRQKTQHQHHPPRESPEWQRTPQNRLPPRAADTSMLMVSPEVGEVEALMADTSTNAEGIEMFWGSTFCDFSTLLGANWGVPEGLATSDKELLDRGDVLGSNHCSGSASISPEPCLSIMDSTPSISSGPTLVPSVNNSRPGSAMRMAAGPIATGECFCLQRHTELLCSLKHPRISSACRENEGGPQIDRVLFNTQELLNACKALTSCRDCARNSDQDVLLLAVMCIRLVLGQLQRTVWKETLTSGPSEASRASTRLPSPEGDPTTPSKSNPAIGGRLQLLVGEFEVTGTDKSVLLHTLRSIMLRKIEFTLTNLKNLVDRKKAIQAASYPPKHDSTGDVGVSLVDCRQDDANDFAHVEQMMQGLLRLIKTLQGAHRRWQDPSGLDY